MTFFKWLCFISVVRSTSLPAIKEPSMTCDSWLQEESAKDLSKCISEAGKWYGCPRQINTGQWWRRRREFPDARYATEEVDVGMAGWQNDTCCSYDPETREKLANASFCASGYCEYNIGADFCVRSPRLACLEQNAKKILYVSNQCCYHPDGSLIRENEEGAGRLNLQENSIKNMPAHYWSDLLPYKQCCGNSSTSASCQQFKTFRPSIVGGYWPRNILIGRGDPDFSTVDGLSYPFMGLGVFVMFETSLENPSVMHISTKRVGRGTVFTGFAASYKTILLQCYMDQNRTVYVQINNHKVDYNQGPAEFTLHNITTKISADKLTFSFEFDDTGVRIRALVISDFLNLIVSIPGIFKNNMLGLLGKYDGESWNDFTNSSKYIAMIIVSDCLLLI